MKSIRKALQILGSVARSPVPISLTEMAQALNENASTLHHILRILRQEGYLHQDPQTKRYTLGYQTLILGEAARRQSALASMAIPVMDDLVQQCGETLTLGVMENDGILYVVQRDGLNSMRMNTHPGRRGSLHATSSGKVGLSFSTHPDPLSLLPANLPQYTPNTITNREMLSRELELVRAQGYAIDREEREVGMVCVGAPIFNATGHLEASLSLSGPTSRMTGSLLDERVRKLVRAAASLSAQLGFTGVYPGRILSEEVHSHGSDTDLT